MGHSLAERHRALSRIAFHAKQRSCAPDVTLGRFPEVSLGNGRSRLPRSCAGDGSTRRQYLRFQAQLASPERMGRISSGKAARNAGLISLPVHSRIIVGV